MHIGRTPMCAPHAYPHILTPTMSISSHMHVHHAHQLTALTNARPPCPSAHTCTSTMSISSHMHVHHVHQLTTQTCTPTMSIHTPCPSTHHVHPLTMSVHSPCPSTHHVRPLTMSIHVSISRCQWPSVVRGATSRNGSCTPPTRRRLCSVAMHCAVLPRPICASGERGERACASV